MKQLKLQRNRRRRVAYSKHAALLATAAFGWCSIASGFAQSRDIAVQAAIRRVLQTQQAAWNRGDIDGFMNGYGRQSGSDAAVFVSEDKITRGWQTVRDRYKKKYSERAAMGTLTFSDLEIRPLSADAAVVLGRWKLKRAKDEPHGCFTLLFRKTPDGWRIVHDHTSAAPEK